VGGGPEVIDELARIMGEGNTPVEIRTAEIGCYGVNRLGRRYHYDGVKDCRAVALLYGGPISCEKSCLGFGSCLTVCTFDAIHLRNDRLPEVDPAKCRGCGRCVDACPHGVIRLQGMTETLFHLNRSNECLAPCRQKCPAQVNIPIFIRHLREKKLRQSLLTIKERNPLPLSVSRTCPHPCENICRRNIADQGVAVNHLARYVGEWELRTGHHIKPPCAPDTGNRVAVIGGGPAGLACAYFLKRAGHRPTIFEGQSRLGGMLRYGIPEYRLPKAIVDWEIQGIIELGVDVRTQAKLGRDYTLAGLFKDDFEAIFLGLGAWYVPPMCIPGETAEGVYCSLDFLSKVSSRLTDFTPKKAVIIGESNTAMDCARSCIRLGLESVSVLCPNERENMSARKRDVCRALEEGVAILYMTRPVRILTDASDRVTGIEYCRLVKTEKKPDKGECLIEVKGSTTRMDADIVINAFARLPDLTYLTDAKKEKVHFKLTPRATLSAVKFSQLAAPKIFAAGDLQTGRSTVIHAVAGGRMAARSIHHLITKGTVALPTDILKRVNPESILKKVRLGQGIPKISIPQLPVAMRCSSFVEEVVATIDSRQAHAESYRCLQCGTHCYDGQTETT
jgi:formate dehydrogenase beta subunit